MPTKTALHIAALRIVSLAAGSLLASNAMAQMGGMYGGGMDMAPHLSGEPLQINRDHVGPSRPDIGTHTSISALSDAAIESSVSRALAKDSVSVPGDDLKSACAGFKTLGPCVEAMHVAQNLNPPGGFEAVKGLTTGPNATSFAKAIQQLQPASDATAEDKKAGHQARKDLDAAEASLP
jgi:hypothetical protein